MLDGARNPPTVFTRAWDVCIIEKKLGTDPQAVARDLMESCGIGSWGFLEGRCLRIADYVRGAGGHPVGDRRRRGLMLTSMKRLPVSTPSIS